MEWTEVRNVYRFLSLEHKKTHDTAPRPNIYVMSACNALIDEAFIEIMMKLSIEYLHDGLF